MGVYEARGTLGKAVKDLALRWAEAKIGWDDPVSHAIETEFLLNLEVDVRNAVAAMDHMAIVLQQVKRDCSE